MSAPEMPRDPRVSEAFRDLGKEHGELSGDWQAKVWSRIAREPQERRTKRLLRLFQVTSAMLVVAVIFLGSFGYWAYTVGEEADEKERKARAALAAYQREVEKAQREVDEAIAEKEKAYQALLDSESVDTRTGVLQGVLAQKEKELADKRLALRELVEDAPRIYALKETAPLAAYQEKVERAQKAINRAIAERDEAYRAILDNKQLEEKEKLQAILAQKEKDLKAKRAALQQLRKREAKKAAVRREKAKRVNVKCDPSDPLCGL